MTLFEFLADFFHMFAVTYLLIILMKRKSCGGISGITQLLLAIVYTTRYLDVWTSYISVYNTSFKIIYLLYHYVIVLLIFGIFRKSYRQNQDTFLTEFLLVPSFLLGLCFNYGMTPTEILWSFSIFLEAVAILPQFYMIYKQNEVDKSLLYYIVPLGLYRLFYIFHWISRYNSDNYFESISNSAGAVYVFLYICALILFSLTKVNVVNDYNNILDRTIFSREKVCENDTKKIGSIYIIPEKV